MRAIRRLRDPKVDGSSGLPSGCVVISVIHINNELLDYNKYYIVGFKCADIKGVSAPCAEEEQTVVC